jgi:hypothetical protein
MKAKEALMREIAQFQAEQKRFEADKATQKEQREGTRAARKEDLLESEMKSRSATPQDWQTAYNAYMSKKAMEIYRAGERAEYAPIPSEGKELVGKHLELD